MASPQTLADVISLAAVKGYLFPGETHTKWDAILATICAAAIEMLKGEVGCDIAQATYTAEKISGRGTSLLMPANWPVTSVASLADETGTGYTAGYDEDYVVEEFGIRATGAGYWALGSGNFTATYTAGYATIPSELVLVAFEWIARKWKTMSQQGWGESSRNYPDGSNATVNADGELTKAQRAVLAKYRRPRL